MKLYLVRHGESEANVVGMVDCDPNNSTSLTGKGLDQVQATAFQLRDVSFDAIFSSQLLRARQTAQFIAKFHSQEILIDPRLNEIFIGQNGVPWRETMKKVRSTGSRWTSKLPEGESFEDEKVRVHSFLEELFLKDFSSVLIVSHGEPLQIIEGLLAGQANSEMKISMLKNAELKIIEGDKGAL